MSTNNVITVTQCFIDENTEKMYVTMGNAYMLNKRFMVGKLPDMEKFKKIKRLNAILQNKECLLSGVEFDEVREILNKLTY